MNYQISKHIKITLAIFMCLLITVHLNAQSKLDTTLSTYLKTRRYTQLTDTIHLDKAVLSNYQAIKEYMFNDKVDMRHLYIPAAGVRDENYKLTISLYDIAGIKIKKAYGEEKPKIESGGFGEPKVIIIWDKPPLAANLSGNDGELIINKLSGKIVFKKY